MLISRRQRQEHTHIPLFGFVSAIPRRAFLATMFKLKLPFAEWPSAHSPSLEEASSLSSDSSDSCVMLRKKPIDLKLYSSIFRQSKSDQDSQSESTSVPSETYSNLYFINSVRLANGLRELERSRELDHTARHHAERMALREAIFHSCRTVSKLKHHLKSRCVGENVQRGKSVRDIHDNMMSCLDQRQNVLSPDFADLGIGMSKGTDGMLYMVQLFRGK